MTSRWAKPSVAWQEWWHLRDGVPREWFEELGAFAPGDEVYLDTGELGALGWATVRSIRTAAPVAEGEGRVVVGTFTHGE